MLELSPNDFFDLSKFSHKKLFEDVEHVWEVLGKLESYLDQIPLGEIRGEVSKDAYLVNPELISIGEGSVVEPGAYIAGPCVIGRNCTVRHGAYLRGHVLVGDNCVLGHATEIKHSIFLDEANAAHFAYIGNCILGNGVNMGAGVKCANLRLDGHPVTIRYRGERIETGMRKLGAIVGDRAHLGCNSVPNPGTLVGMGAICHPCVSFGGYVPHGSVVKTHDDQFIGSSSAC